MGRLDLPDKWRDEDLTERRKRTRRRHKRGGRRSGDNMFRCIIAGHSFVFIGLNPFGYPVMVCQRCLKRKVLVK